MQNFKKSDIVVISFQNIGTCELLSNGRKNPFAPNEKIYKVRQIATNKIIQINSLYFKYENK
jgi:hypothetical protein